MHLVSQRKQRRSTRIKFSQTVLKPFNLSFPFHKILLPLLVFNPSLCTTGTEQTMLQELWSSEGTAEQQSSQQLHGQTAVTNTNSYSNWQLHHMSASTLEAASLPCTSVSLLCLIIILISARQAPADNSSPVLSRKDYIAWHFNNINLRCPSSSAFHVKWQPWPLPRWGRQRTQSRWYNWASSPSFLLTTGQAQRSWWTVPRRHSFPEPSPGTSHTYVCRAQQFPLFICLAAWPSTLKFTTASTVHHHLPSRVSVASQRDAQSPAVPNNVTWQTASPLSRIPSTTVILSGTACSSSAPVTDRVPQGTEPGTEPEVSPQTSPVTASPVCPSNPTTAINSTWCWTVTADPTAGSSCAVSCWSATMSSLVRLAGGVLAPPPETTRWERAETGEDVQAVRVFQSKKIRKK